MPEYKVFVVEATLYQRGWGAAPEGLLCFISEELAYEFYEKEYDEMARKHAESGSKNATPDVYIDYTMIGYKPCLEEVFNKVQAAGKLWISNIKELF